MTNHEPGMREQLDAAIERIQKTLREYPWHIGQSARIRVTLLEETDEQNEKTVCPIAMLSMHTSEQQIETVLANPAHREWADRVEAIARTDIAEHVKRIAAENGSAPPTARNELRRYAAALLINDEPKSGTAAELVDLERRRSGCSPTQAITPGARSAPDSHARSPPPTTNSKPSTRRCTTNHYPRTERQEQQPGTSRSKRPRMHEQRELPGGAMNDAITT